MRACDACDGTGSVDDFDCAPGEGQTFCEECDGTGEVPEYTNVRNYARTLRRLSHELRRALGDRCWDEAEELAADIARTADRMAQDVL